MPDDSTRQTDLTPSSNGATTIFDASGRVTGRTSPGSSGTTTIYGADGRKVGTVTTQTGR